MNSDAGVADATDLATQKAQTPKPDDGLAVGGGSEQSLEAWIFVSLIGGVLVLTSTVARVFGIVEPQVAQIPAAIGAIVLGSALFVAAIREILSNKLGSATLAALAITAAIAIGKYEAAGYIAFILLFIDRLLRRTAWGARRAIEELVRLTPDKARLVTDGQEVDVRLKQISPGDIVRVRPGENLPVDGVVVSGRSSVNQASLTGEALPVEVEEGTEVFAGTTNETGMLDIRVTLVGEDTTIGKVATLIREAESSKSSKQLLIEQVASFFVPVVLLVAAIVWMFTEDIEQAITVLVVTTPAALLISGPTAMMAAFAAAARLGVMIKQTSYLEAAANIDTVVFDKTGTLTTGRFAVSRLAPAPGVEGAHLLQAAADAEAQSNHPLARSIMETATKARITPAPDLQVEEVHGRGVRATGDGTELIAGRAAWIQELNPDTRDDIAHVEQQIEGMTGVHLMRNGQYLGAVGLEDKLRFNAKGVVERVRDLGAQRLLLFTGDRLPVAKRVGAAVGVDHIEAECLPEEKHTLVGEYVGDGRRVLMVGDGINDGPSLATADVGVAMGLSGSDIATNSAGVALMNDDLSRIPFLMMLARKSRTVVGQNIAASILIALVGLAIAATGTISLSMAALYHFLGDLFVIGNSFRLIRFGEDFAQQSSDFDSAPAAQDAKRPQRTGSASLVSAGAA
ncbi:MAG: cation-translocating P-type ATPase [Planctomycetota bacterium]